MSVHIGTQLADFVESLVERSTIEAYLATEYRFDSEHPLKLRIGSGNSSLSSIYGMLHVSSAAIITAWNPRSELRANEENTAAQQQLIDNLVYLNLRHRWGIGADLQGHWPPEESCLVFGIDLPAIVALANRFRQNGFVWIPFDAVPRLTLLR